MGRVVSLFLPAWPTDRLRRSRGDAAPPAEAPLALAARDGGRRVLYAVDAAARAAGLRPGMSVAAAQALTPHLLIKKADPAADAAALEKLALWLLRYAPVAAPDPPDGAVIDTSGADHLHGGETAMLRDMIARLAAHGVAARAALADSLGAAHALARYGAGRARVVPPGGDAAALRPLPIAALRLAPGTADALRALGFERVGDLAAAPRAPIALRFGDEPLRRLDQAFGRLPEPIEPVRPEEIVEVQRLFAEPIRAPETIARHVEALALDLGAALERRELGARRLDLLFHRVDARLQAVRLGLAAPTRDPKSFFRLLRAKIETVDPGFGVETLRLAASWAEPLAPRQTGLAAPKEPDLAPLIDTLVNRVGEARVFRLAPTQSDAPERSQRREPPLAPRTTLRWRSDWPRPVRLFDVPEPIEALAALPDSPPLFFVWRGKRRRILRADGPERIFGEWWKRDAELKAVRDYFRVEDEEGARYWIFRRGDGEDAETGSHRWLLHGVFA